MDWGRGRRGEREREREIEVKDFSSITSNELFKTKLIVLLRHLRDPLLQ